MVTKYARKIQEIAPKVIENPEFVKLLSISTQSKINIVLNFKDTKETNDMDEENISNISLCDVSELSSHSLD